MDVIESLRLRAVRCTDCGLTRWALFSGLEQAMARPCDLCGGTLAPERRHPGGGPRTLPFERRDALAGDRSTLAG